MSCPYPSQQRQGYTHGYFSRSRPERKKKPKALRRITLALFSLTAGLGLFLTVLAPLHGQIGVNFLAVLEPYFQFTYHFRAWQIGVVLFVKYLFAPFLLYVGYLIGRAVLGRMAGWSARRIFTPTRQGLAGRLRIRAAALEAAIDQPVAAVIDGWARLRLWLDKGRPKKAGFLRRFAAVIPRWLRRFYLGFCTLFIGLQIVTIAPIAFEFAKRPKTYMAMREHCVKCHGLNRPANFNHTEAVWELTMDRMYRHAKDQDIDLPLEIRPHIVEFLVTLRGYSNGRLLRSKCYVCHTPWRIFDRRRTPEEWSLLIDRKHRENTFHISRRQRDQITAFLSTQEDRVATPAASDWDYDKKILFEGKCAVCHTLDIIFMPHIKDADWDRILFRMGQKEPSFHNSEEAMSLRPLIDKARSDKDLFFSSFPHSTMREETYER